VPPPTGTCAGVCENPVATMNETAMTPTAINKKLRINWCFGLMIIQLCNARLKQA